jgi:hypothetical protein
LHPHLIVRRLPRLGWVGLKVLLLSGIESKAALNGVLWEKGSDEFYGIYGKEMIFAKLGCVLNSL